MINEFKKYDKEHTRLVTISVSDFNELIKETNISIETKRDYDLKSLESINDMNKKIGEPEINLNEYIADWLYDIVGDEVEGSNGVPTYIEASSWCPMASIGDVFESAKFSITITD